MPMVPNQPGSTAGNLQEKMANATNQNRVETNRANESAASAEKGRRSLGKLVRNLALGAIPLAVLGLAGDVYTGGAISGALGAVLKTLTSLNLGQLFSGNVAENISQVGEKVSNEAIIGGVGNFKPDVGNFNTLAADPLGSLNKLASGQGITTDK